MEAQMDVSESGENKITKKQSSLFLKNSLQF